MVSVFHNIDLGLFCKNLRHFKRPSITVSLEGYIGLLYTFVNNTRFTT